MSNILEKIVADKQLEVAQKKQAIPVETYKDYPNYKLERRSLKASLLKEGSTGIIAEYKRKSPSKGIINATAQVEDVVKAYSKAAAGISVLTDEKYFGGTNDDLIAARKVATVPLLRKEFIVDEYQIHEARAIGADLILLIAACLTPEQVKHFASVAKQLELEVLLEIHDETELVHICDEVDFVGVNNRNLKTFSVDINTSLRLFDSIPADKPAIAESGISNTDAILTLREAGFKGFLIGENFMKENDPSFAFASFVESLQSSVKNE
ncbi:indole-3-glycerol phosphate synthase TrpC [Danxiaibacter flavus]|uniref:indole-3-glycerol-phosphate synthase n=1 Tax=Danxiaibacter flavus TaxID=3049108 RepID=A0ABV3ZBV5_9BACT|nr:indole-3-glycerol phosphate synthase TrpC [Chitinophagaceae bacterium DXS]